MTIISAMFGRVRKEESGYMGMLRRLGTLGIFLVVLSLAAYSQNPAGEAEVKSNANLRSDPSSLNKPIGHLSPSDTVELLSTEPTNGYYHVRTEEGDEGWVWGKALTILTAETLDAAIVATSGAPSDSISADWEKPAPNRVTFNGSEGSCPWKGSGFDSDQYELKNRTDVPAAYHDVTWDAVRNLPYPVAPAWRKNWSAEQLAKIKPYEGEALRVVGYLVAIKPQNKSSGTGEGTNCKFIRAADTDIHLALAAQAGGPENDSVVVEFTPRFTQKHPKWTKAKLGPWLNADKPVRVSGWLMLDPDHRNHLHKYRGTLWEIHPITTFEVFQSGVFVDLDHVP